MQHRYIRVWDAPLRLFHWLLAATVSAAIVTGWLGGTLMLWHGRLGLLVLGLLVFRLLWGFVGSSYARWSYILRAPLSIPAYLRGQWRQAGHNPIGALSVLAMLGLLSFQVGSGLLANDDIAFQGPLYRVVDAESSAWLTALHRQAKWLLLGLLGLHLLAILLYRLKGKALVPAMITGQSLQEYPEQRAAQGGSWGAALLAALLAGALVWGVQWAEQALAPEAPAATSKAADW